MCRYGGITESKERSRSHTPFQTFPIEYGIGEVRTFQSLQWDTITIAVIKNPPFLSSTDPQLSTQTFHLFLPKVYVWAWWRPSRIRCAIGQWLLPALSLVWATAVASWCWRQCYRTVARCLDKMENPSMKLWAFEKFIGSHRNILECEKWSSWWLMFISVWWVECFGKRSSFMTRRGRSNGRNIEGLFYFQHRHHHEHFHPLFESSTPPQYVAQKIRRLQRWALDRSTARFILCGSVLDGGQVCG